MHGGVEHEDAAATLDQIRAGGGHLVLVAQRRALEIKTALDKGDFSGALALTQQLAEKLSHLARAQDNMGILDGNRIIRVRDVQVGMVVPGVGEVSEVGPCPGCGDDSCESVVFTIDGTPVVFDGDMEMVVKAPPSP